MTAESLLQSFFDLKRNRLVRLRALSDGAFHTDGRHRTRIAFARNMMGRVSATINPGRHQSPRRQMRTSPITGVP